MKKRILVGAMSALLLATTSWADDKEKDEDRLKNAGTVLTEILNIPDDIPQDLLDKADCVVVFPSVLKAAFVVGGSYGRGAMTCRRGENFNGSWGAPSMMALEGGFDFGRTSQEHAAFTAEGGEMNYYFFWGPSIAKVLGRYADLTGHMPMPPKWALGNQQSRYSY